MSTEETFSREDLDAAVDAVLVAAEDIGDDTFRVGVAEGAKEVRDRLLPERELPLAGGNGDGR